MSKEIKQKSSLKPNVMSIIDKIFEEGVEQGIEQGVERSIIKLYQKGMNAELIADYFDYPVSNVKQIISDYFVKQQNEA